MSVTLGVDVSDTRTIRCPVPTDFETTCKFAQFIASCADSGYTLSGAETVEGSSQRDPYTVGVKLTFERKTT